MSLTVSSAFIRHSRAQRAEPLRRFTLGGRDCSADVLRWPTLRFRADTIDLGTTTVQLSNVGRGYDALVDDPHGLSTSCELALGFALADGGTEYLSLFTGAPSNAAFDDGGTRLRLQLQGRTRRLSDASLGAATESGGLDFTTSAHHPAELAWTLVTCYGGFSAVASDGNPDVDFAEWQAWQDADRVRDVRVRAYLTGERVYRVLETLAVMDARTISVRNGRLRFRDAVQPFSATAPVLPAEVMLDWAVTLDPADLTNHFFVEAAYDPAKGTFTAQYTKVHSASEAEHGRHSGRFSSRGVWFAGQADARYLAEDRVRFGHALAPRLRVRTPLAGGLEHGVGEVVTWAGSGFGLAGRLFRVLEQAVDLEAGTCELTLELARHRPWQFEGTAAQANLWVRTLTPVGSGGLLALGEDTGPMPLMRRQGAGDFAATGAWGTALAVVAGETVLLGGPPAGGGTQSVIQRSSDAGSTCVVVSSLAPNVPAVYDLFRVSSGTWLASAHSGGIWRSTDAGSTWALTHTLSPGYHVQRFFRAGSGTLWGGTGFSAPGGTGLHVWESLDDGVSWQPRCTVTSGGSLRASGWFHVSDSEWLLGQEGAGLDDLRVLRGTRTAAGSLAWSEVLAQAAFARMLRTDSGHLLMGFEQEATTQGGGIWRSVDQGSSWFEDARPVKRGNIALLAASDGTVDAYVARMTVGPRTDHYRNYAPDELP